MTAAEIVLPWPDRGLSPNARVHWAKKAKAAKSARRAAAWHAKAAGWHNVEWPDSRLHLWVDVFPPSKRRFDVDNLVASMKASFDGIADAIGIDDSLFVPHPDLKDEVRKGGEIRIRITGAPT